MPFDPNEYLKSQEKSNKEFNPDSYLKEGGVEKKTLNNASDSTSPSLPNGGITDLNSLPNGSNAIPTPLTQQGQQGYLADQQVKQDKANQLTKELSDYQTAYKQAHKDNISKEKTKVKEETATGGVGTSFMTGLANLNKGLYKTPRYIYELAAAPQNYLAEKLGIPELKANYEQVKQATGFASPLTILDNLGDVAAKDEKYFSDKTQKYNDGIVSSLSKGNFKDAGSQIVNNIAQSVPSMIGMALTDGAGSIGNLGYVQKTLVNALPFASSQNEALKSEGIPNYIAPINGALNGLSEVIFDQSFGTQAAINKIVSVFKNEGKDLAVDAAKEMTKGYLAKAMKGVGALKPFATGAAEEMTTQFAQNLVDKYTINPEKDLTEGVLDAGLVGSVMTGSIETGGLALSGRYNSKQKTELTKLSQQRSDIVDDLDNPNLPDDVKETLNDNLGVVDAKIEGITEDAEKEIQSLPKEIKDAVKAKQKELSVIEEQSSQDGITDTTKDILKQKAKAVETEINQIIDNSKTQSNEKTNEQNGKLENGQENGFKIQDERVQSEGKNDGQNEVQKEVGGQDAVKKGNIPENNQQQREGTAEQQQGQQEDRKYQEEPITSPKTEAGSSDSTIEGGKEQKVIIKEGDKTSLPPNLEGGRERNFEFKDGEWKQKVGNDYTDISPKTQEQLNIKFNNEQGTTIKETKVEAQPIEKPTTTEKVGNAEDTKVVEPVSKAGDDLRKVADIIRQGKINKLGGFKASTGFDAVWDTSLEVVAKSIEGGAKIADAIQSGLKHIKESDWYKNLSDKEDFDKKYSDHLQNELNDKAGIVEAKDSNDLNEFAQPTERPKVSGIKKGLLSDEIISSVNIDKVSDKEMLEKGKELIDTGEVKPLDIISEIAGVSKESRSASESVVDFVIGREGGSPRALQPKEVVALIWYKTDLDNRYYEALKEHNKLTEKGESTASLDKKLADIRQEIEAYQITSLITASQQSLAFRLRQGLLDSNFNLASFVEDYKATNKGYISPEKLAEFKKMSAELDAVKAELKDLQAKDAERIDKEAFENIVDDVDSKDGIKNISLDDLLEKSKATKEKKKIAIDKFNSEFDNFFKAIGKKSVQSTILPYAKQLADATPHIMGMAKALKDIGGLTIKQISQQIHAKISPYIEGITEKDVNEIINKKGVMSPELKRKLYIKQLEKQITELDQQIEDGKRKIVTKEDKYKHDQEINDLRDIREAKKERLAEVDPEYGERRKLETDLKNAQKSLDDWQKKIDNNDFTLAEKKEQNVDEKLQKLRDKRDAVRDKFKEAKEAYEKSLITPEMIAEKEVSKKLDANKKAIDDLRDKLDNNDLSTNTKQTSLWTAEIGKLEQEKADLQKELNERRKATKESKITENQVRQPKILEDGSLSIPNEYIRELVRNGVTDINDLTAKVKEIVSKDLPSITDRQVRDAITGYGKELGQTKDEIVKQINTAKRIGKLYSKLEDLSNKKKNVKTGKEKSEITEEEIKIRKEIRTLEKGLPKTEQEISMDVEAYEKALETRKKALQEKIDNNQIQLDNEPKSSLFSPKISKLKKEIEADKKEIERLQDESGITDEKRNKLRIQQLTRYEQEKLRQIKEKDFSIKKPKQYVRSKETIKKEQEAWLIRDAFEAAKYKNELDNRSKTKKTVDITLDTILGLQRALTLGADMGTTLLQGGILNLSQNPIKSFKDLYSNIKSAKSEKTEAEFYAELKTDDNYYKAKIAKLGLQEPSLKQSAKDAEIQGGGLINGTFEAAASILASPLYFAGKKKAFNIVKESAREYNPYALGERFYAPSVNRLRMTLFNDMVYALEKQGYTIENDLDKFKQAATAVNNLTLRGRLRDLEPIANSLSVGFTAPRKLAATFSLINPYYWGHLLYTNPTVAKVAMLRFGKYLATITAISLVYSAYKSGDDDENKDMLNPYSADFLTWKIGNTRIDMTLGMKQNLVFLSRLLGGKYKSSSSYETKELGDANVPTRLDITGRFAMGKTSPIPHQVLMYMGESKGREVDWGDETQKSITSLWVQNVKELSKEHPREMVALLTTMAILGQGQSTYGGVEFLDQLDPKNKKLISLFNRKEMSVYTPTRPNVKVSDKEDGKIRGLDTKEYELFKKGYDSYFKKEVESRYNELNKMTLDKFESTIKNIKKKAKEEGIVSVGLYDPKEFEIEYNDKKYNDDKQVRTIYNYIDEYKKSDDYKSIKEQLTVANKNLKASGNKGFNVDAKIQKIAIDVAKKKFMLENIDKETGKLKLTEKE